MPEPPGYSVSLVARTPQAAGPPTLVEVDRLVVDQVRYSDELNRPGAATLGAKLASISGPVRTRLADLRRFPCEVRIHRGGVLAWAGEVRTLAVKEQVVELNCSGLLGYLARMGVTADLIYNGVDQFTIAKGLVDHWQALPYGNWGIGTGAIGTSGVPRDRAYLRNELHNIGTRVAELGAVDNGFDAHVDPSTRNLVLSYPGRGVDLSASVFVDRRNIDSASVAQSVAPGDVVSDGSFVGTYNVEGGSASIYEPRANTDVRATFGRCWASETYDGVSVPATLRGHGDAYLAPRGEQLFQPGATIVPRIGCEPGDLRAGDRVSYSYDAGLGTQSGVFRLAKVETTADDGGRERMALEFI